MNPFDSIKDKANKIQNILDGKKPYNSETNNTVQLINTINKEYYLAPEMGDVIGISRGFYEHYGIYIGNNRVIHFTSLESDTSLNNLIMETDMVHFMRNQKYFYVVDIEKLNQGMKKAEIVDDLANLLFGIDTSKIQGSTYNIFSPTEVVERAKSLLGQGGYDLTYNNCEHIAMWCKTGVKECNQILTKPYRNYFEYPFMTTN